MQLEENGGPSFGYSVPNIGSLRTSKFELRTSKLVPAFQRWGTSHLAGAPFELVQGRIRALASGSAAMTVLTSDPHLCATCVVRFRGLEFWGLGIDVGCLPNRFSSQVSRAPRSSRIWRTESFIIGLGGNLEVWDGALSSSIGILIWDGV